MIKQSIKLINWNALLQNKTVNEMSRCFTETLLKIMEMYVPNNTIMVNDKDAPWMTPAAKCAIRRNKRVYVKWKQGGRKPEEKLRVNQIQRETNLIIEEAKDKYHAELGDKLCDSRNGQKVIWTAHKRLLNKKKTLNIPPIF